MSAAWSRDGEWLATVAGSEVLVWKWQDDRPRAYLRLTELHPATSRAEFSPDGQLLVTYGGDNDALVWNLSAIRER